MNSTILLIAGNYDIIDQIQSTLGDFPSVLQIAFNHRDAFSMLGSQIFDCIIVDGAMLDRYSHQATFIELKKLYSDIPTVVIADVDDVNQSIEDDVLFLQNLNEYQLHKVLYETLSKGSQALRLSSSSASKTLQHQNEIQVLFDLSRSLAELLDLETVLHRVVASVQQLTQADESMILLPDGNGDLILRASIGEGHASDVLVLEAEEAMVEQVFSSGRPLKRTTRIDSDKLDRIDKSLLFVPIMLQGSAIGVLGVKNQQTPKLFDANEEDLLVNLASFAAVAINNARIHDASINRTRELEILVEASIVLNSTLPFDLTLMNICQHLTEALHVNRTEIFEWDKSENQLRVLARYQHSIWPRKQTPVIHIWNWDGIHHKWLSDDYILIDKFSDSVLVENIHRLGASSCLMIPIRLNGQVLGGIVAYFIDSMDLDNGYLYSFIENVVPDASALLKRIGDGDISSYENDCFFLLDRVNTTLGASWTQLVRVEQGTYLMLYAESGVGVWLDNLYPYIDLSRNDDLQKVLVQEPYVKLRSSKDTIPSGALALLQHTFANAMLALPLVMRGKVTGVVVFGDTIHSREFNIRDISIGRAIIGQASIALENAKLIHDLEKSLEELRNTQRRLVQNARLTAMGELSAIVAHQINNPLTSIIIDAELLLMNAKKESLDNESLKSIIRAGKRAAGVARRLLSFARPHHLQANMEAINLNETLDDVIQLVQTYIERTGVKLIVHWLEGFSPYVDAKRGQLEDVWLNLLLNANDALATVKSPQIDVWIDNDLPDLVSIVVQDNGTGIPEGIQDHVFEPFFTTKLEGQGTGLGLYICQQIVHECHGSIRIETSPHQGAKFLVQLPTVALPL